MAVEYPSSWTNVCNLALGRLGSEPIVNLTDGTPNAAHCTRYLGEAIEDVYGEHDWNGATVRMQLNTVDPTPVFKYAYTYQLPGDFIRPVEVEAAGSSWEIEGNQLLTDAEEVYLAYIARPAEAGVVPPYLRTAIAARLAVLLVTAIESGEALTKRIEREWDNPNPPHRGALQRALEADGRRVSTQITDAPRSFTYYDELR